MDSIAQFVLDHAQYAQWYIFAILVIGGFNLPTSEELWITLSAVLAATVVPENTYKLFAAVFLGAYTSDSITYWIGRILGPKLWNIRWFAKAISRRKINKVQKYFDKYGFFTLLVGRFIPFGGRNCLYTAAGLGKMHYGKFLLADGIACFNTNIIIFSLAYHLAGNYQALLSSIQSFNIFLGSAFLVAIIAYIWYKRKKTSAS
jgi:membrane protein DedA with SNARE-associated domain